ncbi:hypothetical protein BDI4_1280030 [Burkholderia diffusa]|nr:hypothetical protein BDI4_1280030 [Burkholderia diffusa]
MERGAGCVGGSVRVDARAGQVFKECERLRQRRIATGGDNASLFRGAGSGRIPAKLRMGW